LAHETVLVVDDEAAIRDLLQDILMLAGYRVLTASDGSEAIRVVQNCAALHLLVTDIRLKTMSGSDLAQNLLARVPDMRVLFISGNPDTQARTDPRVDFLQKPFKAAVLRERIRKLLDR